VLAIGTAVYDVRHRGQAPSRVEPQLVQAQHQLRALPASRDRTVAGALTDLVTAVGFFRIAVDSGTYESARLDDVDAAQRRDTGERVVAPVPRGHDGDQATCAAQSPYSDV
jgi:hypothetical protein